MRRPTKRPWIKAAAAAMNTTGPRLKAANTEINRLFDKKADPEHDQQQDGYH